MFTRCAVVTGANQGIGYEIVKGLKKALPAEYAVVLCSRDEEKGKLVIFWTFVNFGTFLIFWV